MTTHVRSQFGWLFASVLSAALTMSCAGGKGGGGTGAATGGADKGAAATELSVHPVGGEGPKTLAEGKGKVVIVDFWATYCEPCKKSFPKYQEIVDQYGGDVAVIAVSVDDPTDVQEDKLKDFAKEAGTSFSIVWDKEHKTAEKYGVKDMPTCFIIDKDGNIAAKHVKYQTGAEDEIASEVKALIGK